MEQILIGENGGGDEADVHDGPQKTLEQNSLNEIAWPTLDPKWGLLPILR